MKKILASKLSAYNKHIAHNAFAVHVLIPTNAWYSRVSYRRDCTYWHTNQKNTLYDWELSQKFWCWAGIFIRGLKSMQIAYESRLVSIRHVISIRQHLRTSKNRSGYLKCVVKHDEQKLLLVGNESLPSAHIDDDPQSTLRGISRMYTQQKLKSKAKYFPNKLLHGYIHKKFKKIATLIRNLL